MKVITQVKQVNPRALIEVVDHNNKQLFYGTKTEIDRLIKKLLREFDVAEINPFVAEIQHGIGEPAIQIRTVQTF